MESHFGGRSDILKIVCAEGVYALRRLHPTINEFGAGFIHNATKFISKSVPETLCNLEADGNGYVILENRIITICPWINGEPLPYTKQRKKEIAFLLGRLHKASNSSMIKEYRPDRIPFCYLPPDKNFIFDIDTVKHILYKDAYNLKSNNPEMREEIDCIISKREDIFRWHDETFNFYDGVKKVFHNMTKGPIHADIYSSNILWENEKITCLIDWDECKTESFCYELARALYEIAGIPDNDVRNLNDVYEFINNYYVEEGAVQKWELDYVFGFIRAIRIFDLLLYINNSVLGEYYNIKYMLSNIRALESLPANYTLSL